MTKDYTGWDFGLGLGPEPKPFFTQECANLRYAAYVKFSLSIIIPTHNRPRILQKTLDCIAAQTLTDLEVIVVSDGPDEKTAEMFTGLEWPFPIQYFAIPKSQQGVCRNRAVEKAKGEIVLLIGDDIFLAPDACERHLKAHQRAARMLHERGEKNYGTLVLGHTTWDPSLNITRLMRWMEKNGVQFGYEKIHQYHKNFLPPGIQHWFTYTSNISLPAKLLYQHQFKEDVLLYGWEDIEWGKRLADAGIPLYYELDARAFHHHVYSDAEVWKRAETLGASAMQMKKIAPELQLLPTGWKKLAYFLIALTPTYRGKHCRMFLRGMRSV